MMDRPESVQTRAVLPRGWVWLAAIAGSWALVALAVTGVMHLLAMV